MLTYLSAQASSVDPGFDPLGSLTSGLLLAQVPPSSWASSSGRASTARHVPHDVRRGAAALARARGADGGDRRVRAAHRGVGRAAVLALLPSAAARLASTSADGTPQVLVGMTLLLAGMALLGLAIGALVRRPVPAVTAAVLVVLVLPVALVLAADLSGDPLAAPAGVSSAQAAVNTVVTFLPTGAASLLTGEGAVEGAPDLGAVGGGLVLAAWVVVPLALAAVRLRTRDVV
nr:hypothetical protein [Cellulosimicrobium sp. MM]